MSIMPNNISVADYIDFVAYDSFEEEYFVEHWRDIIADNELYDIYFSKSTFFSWCAISELKFLEDDFVLHFSSYLDWRAINLTQNISERLLYYFSKDGSKIFYDDNPCLFRKYFRDRRVVKRHVGIPPLHPKRLNYSGDEYYTISMSAAN